MRQGQPRRLGTIRVAQQGEPNTKLEVLIMTTRLNWHPVCYAVVFVVVAVTVALALVLPVDMVNRVVVDRLVADNLEY